MTQSYWIYQQLEPQDRLTNGFAKPSGYRPIAPIQHMTQDQRDWLHYNALSEDEQNRIQDEYLQRHGIDVNPKMK